MKVELVKKRTCPKCGKVYKGVPALSREDNTTPICPTCGTRESLEAMGVSNDEIEKIINELPSNLNDIKDLD